MFLPQLCRVLCAFSTLSPASRLAGPEALKKQAAKKQAGFTGLRLGDTMM
jgi:hypothetical protein